MEHLHNTFEAETGLNENMITAAREYLKFGFWAIPLVSRSKKAAIKWKPYQARPPTEEELVGWFSGGEPNVALVTGNGVVVVDVDDPSLLDQVLDRCGETPMRSQTPSHGLHLYYRMRGGVHYGNAVKIKDQPLDLRCEGAYAVCPWSRNIQGVPYRWLGDVLPASDLPLLKVKWLRERRPTPKLTRIEDSACRVVTRTGGKVRNILNPEGYAMRIESVQGARGSAALVRVVCILRDAGRSPQQALEFLQHWNQSKALPPWSDRELEHAVRRHYGLR